MVSRLCRVGTSPSVNTDTVSSVVVIASSEHLSTTGENDGHASRLEEVLFDIQYTIFFGLCKRETYVVPRVDEMNGPFSLVFFVHFADEH
jgi:hypothetical protein